MDANTLQRRLEWANKRTKFAWAKYYEQVNGALHEAHEQYDRVERWSAPDDVSIPAHIKQEMKEMAKALKKQWECPVCADFIADGDLVITNCGHYYCKACLDQWKATEQRNGNPKWTCGMCNRKHKFNDE